MACACQGNKTENKTFTYTSPNGKKTTYKTEVEAQAARIRNGGGSYVSSSG